VVLTRPRNDIEARNPTQRAQDAGAAQGAVPDRRFADDAWQNDPRFAALARAYAAQAASLQQTLAAAPLEERSKAQMGFMLRQVVDALSPANSLATNPEAMKLAVESGGASLMEGMKLYLARTRSSRTPWRRATTCSWCRGATFPSRSST
jgi:hypothetical protein